MLCSFVAGRTDFFASQDYTEGGRPEWDGTIGEACMKAAKRVPWITGAFSDCQEANGTRKVPNHKMTDYRRLMVYLTGGFIWTGRR